MLSVDPGEVVRVETRDAADGQIKLGMTVDDVASLASNVSHPLTGPIFVNGAEPGDLLEIEFVDFVSQPYGWTRIRPGGGFLRGIIDGPFLAHWTMEDGWARSDQLPGVRIPEGAFMGTAGVAPSHTQLKEWTAREAEVAKRGGLAPPPDAENAVPATGPPARKGLRTVPPRENGGNMDIKNLTKGSKLFHPRCGRGRFVLLRRCPLRARRFRVLHHRDRNGARRLICALRCISKRRPMRASNFRVLLIAACSLKQNGPAPANFIATMGIPLDEGGVNHGEGRDVGPRGAPCSI